MRLASLLATLAAALMAAASASVLAKLPPPSDDAKAKAAETAAKTAWSDKVAAFKLCQAMDRAAASYRNSAKAATPAIDTPPCADPGPYVAPVAAAAASAAPAASAASAAAATTTTATAPTPVKK
jgi:hypothetical protein